MSVGTFGPETHRLRDGTKVLIRNMRAADAPQQLELRRENAGEPSHMLLREADEVPSDVPAAARQNRAFVRSSNDLLLAAFARVEGRTRMVGLLSLMGSKLRRIAHVVNLGISVRADFRGRGLGGVMMACALRWARENPQVRKVTLEVVAGNTAALRLYGSLGFVTEGVRRGQMRIDGRYVDDVLMALTVKPARRRRGAGALNTIPPYAPQGRSQTQRRSARRPGSGSGGARGEKR